MHGVVPSLAPPWEKKGPAAERRGGEGHARSFHLRQPRRLVLGEEGVDKVVERFAA